MKSLTALKIERVVRKDSMGSTHFLVHIYGKIIAKDSKLLFCHQSHVDSLQVKMEKEIGNRDRQAGQSGWVYIKLFCPSDISSVKFNHGEGIR